MDGPAVLAVLLFTMLLGGFIALTGYRAILYARKKLEREREPAEALIVDYKGHVSGYGRFSRHWWSPVVEFTAGGQSRRLEYENRLSREEHPVGTAVRIRYDADDPSRFHVEGDFEEEQGGRFALRAGLWIVFGTAALLLLLYLLPTRTVTG